MSSLRRGDDEFHHSDCSHRWIAPPRVDQQVWEAEMAAHLERHRRFMGRLPAEEPVADEVIAERDNRRIRQRESRAAARRWTV